MEKQFEELEAELKKKALERLEDLKKKVREASRIFSE